MSLFVSFSSLCIEDWDKRNKIVGQAIFDIEVFEKFTREMMDESDTELGKVRNNGKLYGEKKERKDEMESFFVC